MLEEKRREAAERGVSGGCEGGKLVSGHNATEKYSSGNREAWINNEAGEQGLLSPVDRINETQGFDIGTESVSSSPVSYIFSHVSVLACSCMSYAFCSEFPHLLDM